MAFVAVVVVLPGTGAWVSRDDGNHLYAGQQLQAGVLPCTSIFNYVGTVSQLFCGGAIATGRRFGTDDVRAVRVAFMALVVLIAAVVLSLARHVTGSHWGTAGAAVFLVSLTPFVTAAAGGPEKYVLVVLFQALSLYAVVRGRWLACGAACAAAGLTWQGGWLLLPVSASALFVSLPRERIPALARLALGAALPVAALVGVYAAFGSLGDLIDATVRFPLTQAGVGFPGTGAQLRRIGSALAASGWPWVVVLALGIALSAAATWAAPRPELRALRTVVWLSLAGYLLMAFADFPSILRLFPVIVPASVGAASAAAWLGRRQPLLRIAAAGLLLLGATTAVGRSVRAHGHGLSRQLQAVDDVRRRLGAEARIIVLGAPEFLVLSHAVSPTPYLLFDRGLDRWIDSTYPGGFRAWSEALLQPPPDAVVVGYLEGDLPQALHARLRSEYRAVKVGPWHLLVRPTFPVATFRSVH